MGLPLARGETFHHEDIATYFMGLRGLLPGGPGAWNPFTSCGLPLLGDGQLGAFDPLNLPYLFLPPSLAIPLSLLAQLLLASWLMAAFLGRLGVGRWPAAFGGLVWLWTGFFWQHLHHLTFLPTALWLPGALWAVERAAARGRGAWGWVSACAALTLLGGSPQLALYVGYVSVLWAGARGAAAGVGGMGARGRRALRGGATAGAAWLLGGMAAAVMLAPFAGAAVERFVDPSGGYARSAAFAVHPLALIRALAPAFLGTPWAEGGYRGPSYWWEEGVFVGLTTLPLAAVGALAAVGGWRGRALAALGGVALLGMLGTLGGVHPLFYYVLPGYGLFRAPGRLYALLTFAAATLAALGLEALSSPPPTLPPDGDEPPAHRRLGRAVRWLVVLGGEALLLAALSLKVGDAPSPAGPWALASAAGSLAAVAALFTGLRRGRIPPRWVGPLATGLLLVEIAAAAGPVNRPVPRSVADTPSEAEAWLGQRAQVNGRRSRVMVEDSAPARYLNAGMEAGYLGVRGYNPLNPQRIAGLMAVSEGGAPGPSDGGIALQTRLPTSPVLDLVAARWLLTTRWGEGLPKHLTLAWRGEGEGALRIYENPRALPRAYLAGPLEVVDGAEAMGRAIRQAALLRPPPLVLSAGEDAGPEVAFEGGAPLGIVSAFDDGGDVVRVTAEVASPGWLVLADTFAAGWTATVDGAPAPILPAYGALRAVALPEVGRREVVFTYHPPGLVWGAALSALGWLTILGLIAWDRRSPSPLPAPSP